MDVGMPMLSMHSIRGICGSRDPQIGVEFFETFLRNWEELRKDMDFS
jgi:aminopeptidase I